jgi:hypothetical protein
VYGLRQPHRIAGRTTSVWQQMMCRVGFPVSLWHVVLRSANLPTPTPRRYSEEKREIVPDGTGVSGGWWSRCVVVDHRVLELPNRGKGGKGGRRAIVTSKEESE